MSTDVTVFKRRENPAVAEDVNLVPCVKTHSATENAVDGNDLVTARDQIFDDATPVGLIRIAV